MLVNKRENSFYFQKNDLIELFKILSDGDDNSLRITHYALRITHSLRITIITNAA